MPEGSLRKGGPARGPPKHQNSFAFKHNKNSRKTRVILKISHNGLCKRCNDKIEWRKKYRKYKPLTAPGICNGCKQRTVKRAYHTLCDSCAGGRGVCAKCVTKLSDEDRNQGDAEETMDVEKSAQRKTNESDEDFDDFDSDEEEIKASKKSPEAVPSSLKAPGAKDVTAAQKKATFEEQHKNEVAGGDVDEDESMDGEEDEEADEDEDDEEGESDEEEGEE